MPIDKESLKKAFGQLNEEPTSISDAFGGVLVEEISRQVRARIEELNLEKGLTCKQARRDMQDYIKNPLMNFDDGLDRIGRLIIHTQRCGTKKCNSLLIRLQCIR